METREDILKKDFSENFIEKMKNAIEMSHYKYGCALPNAYYVIFGIAEVLREDVYGCVKTIRRS